MKRSDVTEAGTLYIVATPIGNLNDISLRALETLKSVDAIAAEDTRHSQKLLQHFGIESRLWTYHDHSSEAATTGLLTQLQQGLSIALISDAGTPLISDPGYRIVREARSQGIRVVPLPGPSAPITALSAAGLPTNRFSFEGFLPSKSTARRKVLQALATETRTMVFFESPHRILESLVDAVAELGGDREMVMARELTKTFETFLSGTLDQVLVQVEQDANQRRGEIVLMFKGAPEQAEKPDGVTPEVERILNVLLKDLPTKQASNLAAEITGVPKKLLYQYAVGKH